MKRTQLLLEQMTDNYSSNDNDEGIIIWNFDKIKNIEYTELDSYRIFNAILNASKERRTEYSIGNIHEEMINSAKLFTLKNSIRDLLLLTKPSKIMEELKMPFDDIFIDFIYNYNDDYVLFGLYLKFFEKMNVERSKILQDKLPNYKNIFGHIFDDDKVIISSYVFSKIANDWYPIDIMLNLRTGKIVKRIRAKEFYKKNKLYVKIERNIRKFIRKLVLNLILFLNEPRVTTYIQEHNNQRRIKKGLIPMPSILRTKIRIDLEEYIEKIHFNGLSHSKLGFSFWVMGHWRTLLSPRFVNKQGQKIWIAPHIVGEGLMPPQIFEVC